MDPHIELFSQAVGDLRNQLLDIREKMAQATIKYNTADELQWREQVLGMLQNITELLPLHAAAVAQPDSMAIITAIGQRIDKSLDDRLSGLVRKMEMVFLLRRREEECHNNLATANAEGNSELSLYWRTRLDEVREIYRTLQ